MTTGRRQVSFYLDDDIAEVWNDIPNQIKGKIANELLREYAKLDDDSQSRLMRSALNHSAATRSNGLKR